MSSGPAQPIPMSSEQHDTEPDIGPKGVRDDDTKPDIGTQCDRDVDDTKPVIGTKGVGDNDTKPEIETVAITSQIHHKYVVPPAPIFIGNPIRVKQNPVPYGPSQYKHREYMFRGNDGGYYCHSMI